MEIILKKRVANDFITVPSTLLDIIKDKENKPKDIGLALYQYFDGVVKDTPAIHDKTWLTMIANWTPPQTPQGSGGLSMTEVVKWYDITKRIDEIDENENNIPFQISSKEAELIFEKLRNQNFKIMKSTSSLIFFLHDLEDATHMKINKEKVSEETGE